MDKTVFLRTPYNYDMAAVSEETGLACDPDEGVTQQSFRDECDINTIVARFGLTGELPGDFRAPVSGDFTGVSDFHSAMTAVRQAEEAFMELPGAMRARFHHDPQELLMFLEDKGNRDEALRLGLLAKPPEVTRDVVQAVDELAARIVPPAK